MNCAPTFASTSPRFPALHSSTSSRVHLNFVHLVLLSFSAALSTTFAREESADASEPNPSIARLLPNLPAEARAPDRSSTGDDEDVVPLTPFKVEGDASDARAGGTDLADYAPRMAAGNLDLPRSANDPLPFLIFARQQISRSGAVNLTEFLQRNLLEAAAVPSADQTSGSGNLSAAVLSSSSLSLRGFGTDETVILVNGRRLPEVVTSGQEAGPAPPDLNMIPLSLVERVEVLPVSASALYSGSPVGGVVNVVLRPATEHTEVNATYTNALGGFDAPSSVVSLQHGRSLLGGALWLRLGATASQTRPATESQLGHIQARLAIRPTADPLHRATPNIRSKTGQPLFGPGTPALTSVAPGADGLGGLAAFDNRQGLRNTALFDSPGRLANSTDSVDMPYGRRQQAASFFGSATYDLFPWLQFGFDGLYSRTVAGRGYSVFPGDLILKAESPFNPFGQDVVVSLNETTRALGENYNQSRVDYSAAVFGMLVKLPANWRVSLDTQYGHSVTQYRGVASIDAARWQQLVDRGSYNPLRDTQNYRPPTAFYDQALVFYGRRGQYVTLGNYRTVDTAVRVANQTLPLPTGPGAVNAGFDYRIVQLDQFTDERRYGDGSLAATSVRWSGRWLQRMSTFGELQAPLLPSRWLPRWIKSVAADVAARYVMADSDNESNLAPTAGLKVELAGGFALRGAVAQANRLPSPVLSKKVKVTTLAAAGPGTGEVSYVSIYDPLRGETYNIQSNWAINPTLRPEAAVTRTLGLTYQHGKVHRFRVSVDYADTRKSGELADLTPQSVVNLENLYPDRVKRAPLAPGDPRPAGRVATVVTGTVNLAWRESQNWSTALDYAWAECLGGRLDLYGRWAYFPRFAVQALPTSTIVDELRHPDGATPGLLMHRVNFGGGWSNQIYGAGVDGRYYHSRVLPLIEQTGQGSRQIAPYCQFDAYLQRDLTSWIPWKNPKYNLRGQVRVNNVLDSAFPRYINAPSGAGVAAYGDWRGRTYSLSLNAAF